jgi:hypothetical protein
LREASRLGQQKLLISAMNELNVNLQHSIVALSAKGWSRRRIARELGINRELELYRPTIARAVPTFLIWHSDGCSVTNAGP